LHRSHRLLPPSSSVAAGGGRGVAWRLQLLEKVLSLAALLPPRGGHRRGGEAGCFSLLPRPVPSAAALDPADGEAATRSAGPLGRNSGCPTGLFLSPSSSSLAGRVDEESRGCWRLAAWRRTFPCFSKRCGYGDQRSSLPLWPMDWRRKLGLHSPLLPEAAGAWPSSYPPGVSAMGGAPIPVVSLK
jgi:hypothetical protein